MDARAGTGWCMAAAMGVERRRAIAIALRGARSWTRSRNIGPRRTALGVGRRRASGRALEHDGRAEPMAAGAEARPLAEHDRAGHEVTEAPPPLGTGAR